MKKTVRKNAGESGGRSRAVAEKGDVRRSSGGPGQQSQRSQSARSISDEGGPARVKRFAKPIGESAPAPGPKSHRERHADKRQPEESGPGRASKPPPLRGRYEPR
jgi:hypothetical protein